MADPGDQSDLRERRKRDPLFAARWVFRVLASAVVRFHWDDCFSRAAALAYTTLFALVPITALSFSMLRVFGFQDEQPVESIRRILEQLLPPMANEQLEEFQEQIFFHLEQFTKNVAALNTLSIAVLCFTSIALLNTIESALNVIWRVSSNLTILEKVFSFWSILTLGVPLITISIFWTTKVTAFAGNTSFALSGIPQYGAFIVPVAISWLALWLLYYKMPAARVRLADAAFGGLFAAALFELVKRAFAYYVSVSAGYSSVYGVIATIPLFLFWLYITWVVVLFGAEVTYQAGSIKILSGRKKYATDLGEVGALLGLRILFFVGRNFIDGRPPLTESEIAIKTGSDPVLVRTCLDVLTRARILSTEDEKSHARSLLISPFRLSLAQVVEAFRSQQKRPDTLFPQDEEEEPSIMELFRDRALVLGEREPREWSLAEFIQVSEAPEAVEAMSTPPVPDGENLL